MYVPLGPEVPGLPGRPISPEGPYMINDEIDQQRAKREIFTRCPGEPGIPSYLNTNSTRDGSVSKSFRANLTHRVH